MKYTKLFSNFKFSITQGISNTILAESSSFMIFYQN